MIALFNYSGVLISILIMLAIAIVLSYGICALSNWYDRRADAREPQPGELFCCEQCKTMIPVEKIIGVGRGGVTTYRICKGCWGNLARSKRNA